MIILEIAGAAGKRLPPFFFFVVRRFLEAGFLVRMLVIGSRLPAHLSRFST